MVKTRIDRLSGDDSESYHEVIRQNSAMKWGGEPNNIARNFGFKGIRRNGKCKN